MFSFDRQALTSYAAAAVVSLLSTAMLIATSAPVGTAGIGA